VRVGFFSFQKVKMHSRPKRTEYERKRRHGIQKDRKIDQVLRPWLEAKYQKVYDEFFTYFKQLDERNPTAKNLTKTNKFRAFLKGMFFYYIICFYDIYLLFYNIYTYILPNFIEYKEPEPTLREPYKLLVPKLCIADVFTTEIAEAAPPPPSPPPTKIPEVAAQITLPQIPDITPAPLDPATLSEELERIIGEISLLAAPVRKMKTGK
jgi:hypothetical protein